MSAPAQSPRSDSLFQGSESVSVEYSMPHIEAKWPLFMLMHEEELTRALNRLLLPLPPVRALDTGWKEGAHKYMMGALEKRIADQGGG